MKSTHVKALIAAVSLLSFLQNGALAQGGQSIAASTPRIAKLTPTQWFASFDQILKANICTAAERHQLEDALSKGVSIVLDPQLKASVQTLLSSLVSRYKVAETQFAQLPPTPQTERLQKAYSEYFSMGGQLFGDYLKVVENPLAADPSTGTPLLAQLLPRKVQLAGIRDALAKFEAQVRTQLGVAPASPYKG